MIFLTPSFKPLKKLSPQQARLMSKNGKLKGYCWLTANEAKKIWQLPSFNFRGFCRFLGFVLSTQD